MSKARRPLPTDIVALVSFDGKVHANQAKPRDRVGMDERARPLEEVVEQWVTFALGKHTWLNVKGTHIRGLLTARRRAKRTAWEVEMLIDAEDDDEVVLSLFNKMVPGVIRAGAERAFLRVDAGSSIVDAARSAGFFAYQHETLYRLNETPDVDAPEVKLRQRGKQDLHGIYQLYNRIAPANVRAIEGATLREWQAAQEKWGGRAQDFVLEDDGAITAYVRVVSGDTGRIGVLADCDRETCGDIARFALSRLKRSSRVLCLVPDHDVAQARALTDLGFEPASRYAVLAKRLTRPVGELANESNKSAIAVS